MQRPQSTRGELTRDEILAAARQLFLAQGFTAATMRQIADAVGITPAAIYNHFPSKDDLFTSVMEDAAPYDQVFELLSDVEADTPERFIQRAFRAVVEFMTEHQDYVRLALIDSQERDGAVLATFLPLVLPQAHEVYRRLQAIDAAHRELRDIPFLVFTRSLVSIVAGFLLTEGVLQAPTVLELPDMDWPSALADIFAFGVLKPSESKGA